MNKTKGFTLLELVIVVIVLGILGAIAIPKYMGIRESAVTTAKTTATDSVRSVFAMAMLDLKQYPSVKQLGEYVHAEAGLEGAKVHPGGIEVVIDKHTYLVPTYIDTACNQQTATADSKVQCVGFIEGEYYAGGVGPAKTTGTTAPIPAETGVVLYKAPTSQAPKGI